MSFNGTLVAKMSKLVTAKVLSVAQQVVDLTGQNVTLFEAADYDYEEEIALPPPPQPPPTFRPSQASENKSSGNININVNVNVRKCQFYY